MNREKKIVQVTRQRLAELVASLQTELKNYSIITCTGGLGAGKTTFIKELLSCWGIDSKMVTSPTFTYVNTYKMGNNITIFHFDLYRLHTLDEFMIAGFDEYLYQPGSIAIIEWPHLIMPLLKYSVVHLVLEYGAAEHERTLIIR